MENQDKLYKQFEDAARKAETKDFARMEAVWNRVEDKLDNKKQRRIAAWWKYTGVAALFLLFMGVGFFFLNSHDNVIAPHATPKHNVTVIDTNAVKNTFSTQKEIVVKSTQKEYDKTNNSGTPNKNNKKEVVVLRGDKAVMQLNNGTTIAGDSIYFNTRTKKARIWNTRSDTGKFRVVAETDKKEETETNLDEVVIEGYRSTSRAKSNVAVTTISSETIEKSTKKERGKKTAEEAKVNGVAYQQSGNITSSATGNATIPPPSFQSVNQGYMSGNSNPAKPATGYDYNTANYQSGYLNKTVADRTAAESKTTIAAPQMLQGRVGGISITGKGISNLSPTVAIRGAASINNNNEPLYVINGIPGNAKDMSALKSDDIDSITVLKDAGATAIYGSRGSNGVIIIKTKYPSAALTKRQKRRLERLNKKLQEQNAGQPAGQSQTESLQPNAPQGKIGVSNEEYEAFEENKFENPATTPLSTFSIDVDNASYTNVRRFLNNGETVPKDAVRVEEMINFFKYNYPQPQGTEPFSINTEYSDAPWNPKHKLLKIGLQGKDIQFTDLPASNLVFLIDVSGSMSDANKLPLLKQSMKILVNQMRKQDRIAIVVYAGAAGLVLPSTSGAEKEKIIAALDNLESGGSTAGGAGIELAYKTALENFVKKGNNRVILATDGDFNVGASSNTDMQTLIEEKRQSGVFLTCLGYGMGNYKDSKLETLADKGNGNYAYIDNMQEAGRFLDKEFKGSMYAIAKDVKIQIEFNPKHVQSYRLIGYENRKLRAEDFVNDAIDAGELGSGHTVTALYEIIPVGTQSEYFSSAPELKYSQPQAAATGNFSNELATIKFRHKKPDEDKSTEIIKVIPNAVLPLQNTSADFKFAAAVAWFGLKLRDSKLVPNKSSEAIINLAKQGLQNDPEGYRAEFIRLVNMVQ